MPLQPTGTCLPVGGYRLQGPPAEWFWSQVLGTVLVFSVATMLGYYVARCLVFRRVRFFSTLRELACAVITAELVYILYATGMLAFVLEATGLVLVPYAIGSLLLATAVTTACGVTILGVASIKKRGACSVDVQRHH